MWRNLSPVDVHVEPYPRSRRKTDALSLWRDRKNWRRGAEGRTLTGERLGVFSLVFRSISP
jgi:hypothetical protein